MDREIVKYLQGDVSSILRRRGFVVEKISGGIEIDKRVSLRVGADRLVHLESEDEERSIALEDFMGEVDSILHDLTSLKKISRLVNKIAYYTSEGDSKSVDAFLSDLKEETLLYTQWGIVEPVKRAYESLKRGSRVSRSGDALLVASKRGDVPKSIASDVVNLLRSVGYSEERIPKLYRGEEE